MPTTKIITATIPTKFRRNQEHGSTLRRCPCCGWQPPAVCPGTVTRKTGGASNVIHAGTIAPTSACVMSAQLYRQSDPARTTHIPRRTFAPPEKKRRHLRQKKKAPHISRAARRTATTPPCSTDAVKCVLMLPNTKSKRAQAVVTPHSAPCTGGQAQNKPRHNTRSRTPSKRAGLQIPGTRTHTHKHHTAHSTKAAIAMAPSSAPERETRLVLCNRATDAVAGNKC